ncbi:MAG: thioredoxin domain-containing protein [Anaerolineaceae bacterium]|nr:thioredoxin domain-containing protein [Anaerolineaceae bacterium]
MKKEALLVNRLIHETSPYLLQHAENPVNWLPWGKEALEQAQMEDKPIFLSIGYAACHWCHVMAHESFEDPVIAKILNQHFVSIKVDREERPDIDSIYMSAVVAMTGQGGWPMSIFLTPDGKPFFGGTYFPPLRRYGMPSFTEILTGIVSVWQEKREEASEAARQLYQHIKKNAATPFSLPESELNPAILERATESLINNYDWEYGGWGTAPKFPMPMTIEFLLSQASYGNSRALGVANHALEAMHRGGMYDLIGGGFHRYSTDLFWLVPHFEKMLYDNALLSLAYLHAFKLSGNPDFKRTCVETLSFMQAEMRDAGGGFFSSLDADSEGEEGKFYTWDFTEIQALIKDQEDLRLLESAYGISPQGNFDGKNIPQRPLKTGQTGGVSTSNSHTQFREEQLIELQEKLRAVRRLRVRPFTDDKILVSWNAFAIRAFAESGRLLKEHRFLTTARNATNFILNACVQDGRLLRSWRQGKANVPAYLEDYAALILALLSLYEANFEDHWYEEAIRWTEKMLELFSDPQGGFFDTQHNQDNLIIRPKDLQDNATPSGNSLAVLALLKMAELSYQASWQDKAEYVLAAMQPAIQQHPHAFSFWLQALDLAVGPRQQVALLWPTGTDIATDPLTESLHAMYRPHVITAGSIFPPASSAPALLKDRPLLAGKATAYVCKDFVCKHPVTEPAEFLNQLDATIK